MLVGSESSLRFRRPIIFGTISSLIVLYLCCFIGEICVCYFLAQLRPLGFGSRGFFVVVC